MAKITGQQIRNLARSIIAEKVPGLRFGQCLLVSLGAWIVWGITASPIARFYAIIGVVVSIFIALMLHFTENIK